MLPILDISDFLADPACDKAADFIRQLRETCHGPGFFYLTGHGIDKRTDQATLEIARQFFDLPLAEREALAIGNSAHF